MLSGAGDTFRLQRSIAVLRGLISQPPARLDRVLPPSPKAPRLWTKGAVQLDVSICLGSAVIREIQNQLPPRAGGALGAFVPPEATIRRFVVIAGKGIIKAHQVRQRRDLTSRQEEDA